MSSSLRILYIVPYVPSLVRVRPYNLIRALIALGHQVTVATLWVDEAEREEAERLIRIGWRLELERQPRWRSFWNCLVHLPSTWPLQAVYSWNPWLANRLVLLASARNGGHSFDVIHVEHLRGVRYGLFLKSRRPQTPVVWDSVDCITHLFKQAAQHSRSRLSRWITRFELGRTRRYEGWLPGHFDRLLVTSAEDRRAFEALNDPHKDQPQISVLPNGVDLEYFRPGRFEEREPATLVISGKMSYHANVAMVTYLFREIMPLVWRERPDVKVWVVGKDPPGEVLALAANPLVRVTGTVSDLRPYLQRATLAVAPLQYGAGIQNKALEAMACATPLVATPRAVAALSLQAGRDACVADDPHEFATSVLTLLGDPSYRHQLGLAGRRYVEVHHNWTEIAGRLEGVYHEIIRTRL